MESGGHCALGQTWDSGFSIERDGFAWRHRPLSRLTVPAPLKAANLRFQRIDTRNRRRMFRPTAEITRLESSNQMSKQCLLEALPAERRIHGRWSVGKAKS